MARSPTTRMGLLEVRSRHDVAARGARLLRAKREVLAGELFRMVRDVLEGRAKLDTVLRAAVKALRARGVPTPTGSTPLPQRPADARETPPTRWGPTAVEAARPHEEGLE